MPVLPFLLVYAWFALEKIIQKITDSIIKPQLNQEQIAKILIVFLIIFVLFSLPQTFGKFVDKNSAFPFRDDNLSILKMQLAEKVKNITEKDAVVMGCDVGVMNFYSDRKYIEFPAGDFSKVIDVIKFYNVSYFTLLGCERRTINSEFYFALYGEKIFAQEYFGQRVLRVKLPSDYKTKVYKIELNETEKDELNRTILKVTEY